MKKIFVTVALGIFLTPAFGQFGVVDKLVPPASVEKKMNEWFIDAKVGIFIHWGIYVVDGTVESWPIQDGVDQAKKYMAQAERFNPQHYDPEQWAALFKEFGAKYVVITAKHHDGVALWDTKQPRALSIARNTPYKKDALGPLFDALRGEGIKCGAYFSNPDWNYPDYPRYTKDSMRYDLWKKDYMKSTQK